MYQSLIGSAALRNNARSLAAALNSEDCERLPDALVDGVRGDMEFGRDFL
jgi:hypothetical protein